MNNIFRSAMFTVLLAVCAGAAGAWIAARCTVDHRGGDRTLHEMVHRNLVLTPEQNRRIEDIETAYDKQQKLLEMNIRAANRELAEAIQDGHEDSPQVEAAVDHIHAAMGALQKATIAHVFAMRAILTPDQARKFDAKIAAALTDVSR